MTGSRRVLKTLAVLHQLHTRCACVQELHRVRALPKKHLKLRTFASFFPRLCGAAASPSSLRLGIVQHNSTDQLQGRAGGPLGQVRSRASERTLWGGGQGTTKTRPRAMTFSAREVGIQIFQILASCHPVAQRECLGQLCPWNRVQILCTANCYEITRHKGSYLIYILPLAYLCPMSSSLFDIQFFIFLMFTDVWN